MSNEAWGGFVKGQLRSRVRIPGIADRCSD
jgi:hypothetical protein